MSEATLLESRVDKIERDNRRLKLAVGALLLALAAVPLIGAVMPEGVQDVIRARAFEVIDENGVRRVRMNDEGFRYNGENENTHAKIDSTGILVMGGDGYLGTAMWSGGVFVAGENGTRRISISNAGIYYNGENTHASISSLGFYYSENGNQVWSTACAPNC